MALLLAIQSVVVEDPPGEVSGEQEEEVDTQPTTIATMVDSPGSTSNTTQLQAQLKTIQLEKDNTTIVQIVPRNGPVRD